MKKSIIAFILAAMLCITMGSSVFATDQTSYITDDFGNLYDYEIEELNEEAAKVYSEYGVGVFYAYLYEDITEYDVSYLVGDTEDYICMLEDEEGWIVYCGGECEEFIGEDQQFFLREVYDEELTYRAGLEAYILSCAELCREYIEGYVPDVNDKDDGEVIEEPSPEAAVMPRFFDSYGLLTDEEEEKLIARLDQISEEYKVDVCIAVFDTIGEESIDDFIGYFYDFAGYGMGEDKDGVLLLIDMEYREFRILSNGKDLGAKAVSKEDIDYITDEITPYLTEDDYAGAFDVFAEECEYEINGEVNGFPFKYLRNIIISLVVGFLVAFIVTGIWKGKLKSVRKQTGATTYLKKDSMQITNANEFYLYRTVTRERKVEKSSSGTSSGRNIGGGSF